MIPTAKRLALAKTDLPPCCLRTHPDDPSIVIVGTYNLNKENGSRVGSIEIFKLDRNELIRISSYKTSGAILDLKFSPFNNNLLVSCHSTGNLMIWDCRIQEGTRSINLTLVDDKQLFDRDTLITSIFFSPVMTDTMLLTLTTGQALMVKLTGQGVVTEAEFFTDQHSLECWTGAFGSQQELSNVVFTGGDDAALIAHDLREPWNSSIFNAKRIHDAGVVSIMPSLKTHNGVGEWNTSRPYDLWTGSYDDCLRTLDLRVVPPQPLIPSIPPLTREKQNLGGGVWRLMPSPLPNDDRLLTCCMYDGARIIDVNNQGEPDIKRFFKADHDSMCYGGDWSINGDFVVTCSFYDSVIQVWSPDQI